MDTAERLASLTAADLVPVVRQVLADEGAWPSRWSVESPDWIHLWPTTRGTYRLSGLADTAVGEQPWLVVLKIVGAVDLPGHHEPTDPFYWKREPMALSSELLQDWPGPFAPVRCWAVDDVVEDESWGPGRRSTPATRP